MKIKTKFHYVSTESEHMRLYEQVCNLYETKGGSMKKQFGAVLLVGTMVFLGANSVFAGTNDPGIQQREQNQERRIDQGVASGQLTPREAGILETKEARIQQNEARMKADGNLTVRERRKLNRQQNQASRAIYRKKHNQRNVAVQ